MKPKSQSSPYQNPWPAWFQLLLILWRIIWFAFCSWTPKFLNPWRLIILKVFGAHISGRPFVHSSSRIQIPWHLTLCDRACIGDKVTLYSLGEIIVHKGATIAQEAYLCTGTHDFNDSALQLITSKIIIEKNVFIGARAMILPGVTIRQNALVGAMSVVAKDVDENKIIVGNPAKEIGQRKNLS